jgi:hypothetical protein
MAIQRITSGIIADGAIVATDIGDGVVTASKIADANVTSSKLASTLSISGSFLSDSITANTSIIANTGSAAAPSIFPTGDTNTGIFFPAADTIAFAEGGAEIMRVASNGNIGIGTTSPSVKLDVSGTLAVRNASTSYINTFCSGGGNRDYQIGVNGASFVFNDITSGTSERMRIDSSGNLLVGTTNTSESAGNGLKLLSGATPNYKVVTSGTDFSTASFMAYSSGASAYRFYVTNAGVINATSATISAISDQRYKENIRDLDVGLDAVMQLRPRKFDWKEGKGQDTKDCRGFIAQEFEQVFPDLIDEWKDPAPEGEEPYKSVRQDLIPVLVKAIQELSAKNDALEARLSALEQA